MSINKNFVVKNGLEVYTDLVLANALSNRVGIGSTNPRAKLDVRGGIAATDIVISGYSTVSNTFHVGSQGSVLTALGIGGSVGVGTNLPGYLLDVRSPVSTGQTGLYVKGDSRITGNLFASNLYFDSASLSNLTVTGISTFSGLISVGGTTGVDGQYLRSTGAGVTWGTFPVLRTSFATTATVGQTGFTTTYNAGFVDVFVNGVRLSPPEFTATDGSNITLTTPCFGGESVDILAYSTISTGSGSGSVGGGSGTNYWVSTTAGIHTLSSVGIGTTNPTSTLTVRGGDVSVGINTSQGVVLTSPNGTKYRLMVENDGTLKTVLVP